MKCGFVRFEGAFSFWHRLFPCFLPLGLAAVNIHSNLFQRDIAPLYSGSVLRYLDTCYAVCLYIGRYWLTAAGRQVKTFTRVVSACLPCMGRPILSSTVGVQLDMQTPRQHWAERGREGVGGCYSKLLDTAFYFVWSPVNVINTGLNVYIYKGLGNLFCAEEKVIASDNG